MALRQENPRSTLLHTLTEPNFLEERDDFSLVLGGPVFQLFHRSFGSFRARGHLPSGRRHRGPHGAPTFNDFLPRRTHHTHHQGGILSLTVTNPSAIFGERL
jgi:hypothetical protein